MAVNRTKENRGVRTADGPGYKKGDEVVAEEVK